MGSFGQTADKLGDPGSEVKFYNHPEGPVLPQNAGNRNVRFRPDHQELEMLSSSSQFGHDFDKWGRHFLINNANHHFHEAIAARYVQRNPDLAIRSAVHQTPDHSREVFPITQDPLHQLLTDVGVFTSASSLTFYLADLFGEDYKNVSFVAESQHNLVHSDVVTADGPVFRAEPQFRNREFLVSTDSWFRPVNFYIGPDGALYVADYYRRIIEHPEWMDEETMENYDITAGMDRGRIFRITPKEGPQADWLNNIRLGELSTKELVRTLEHDNIWWRRHAQRLLVDRQDSDAISLLNELVESSASAVGRLHGLWTLDGLGALDTASIRRGLTDEEAGVRENAVKLAEHPSLLAGLQELEDDPSVRVQYQLLLTLGGFDSPEIRHLRNRILFRHIEDHWFQIAALSAPSSRGLNMLEQTIEELADQPTEGRKSYFGHVGAILAAGGNQAEMRNVIRRTAGNVSPEDSWWQAAVLKGFADQVQRSDIDPGLLAGERQTLIDSFFTSEHPQIREAVLQLLEGIGLSDELETSVLRNAEAIVTDREADERFRADAVRLLGLADPEAHKQMFFDLIEPSESGIVQWASLQVLAQVPGRQIGEVILDQWERLTPQVRDQAINVLMADQERIGLLLDAVEDNKVLVSTIGWGRRVSLMRDRGGDEQARALRDRARELLSRDPAARREVVEQYQAAINDYTPDRDRGREVFTSVCGMCHQMGGEYGTEFGPDAGTFQHWSPQALIAKILDPNRSVADGFELWIVQRSSGETVSGVMVNETDQSITIRQASGAEIIIPRSDIESITGSNISPMPEGLEQQINEQEMADLIEFIRRGGR